MHDNSQVFQNYFRQYSSDGKTITLSEFQLFLTQQQDAGDPLLEDIERLTAFMRDFVRDPRRNVEPPYFTVKEVCFRKNVILNLLYLMNWFTPRDLVYVLPVFTTKRALGCSAECYQPGHDQTSYPLLDRLFTQHVIFCCVLISQQYLHHL